MCLSDIHGDRKHLTCCLRGISGDYSVCFEGYACRKACEESGRMQHGVRSVCGMNGWVEVIVAGSRLRCSFQVEMNVEVTSSDFTLSCVSIRDIEFANRATKKASPWHHEDTRYQDTYACGHSISQWSVEVLKQLECSSLYPKDMRHVGGAYMYLDGCASQCLRNAIPARYERLSSGRVLAMGRQISLATAQRVFFGFLYHL